MSGVLHAIGGFCARHRFPVLGAWLLVAGGFVYLLATVGPVTNNDLTLPGTGSQAATDLLAKEFPPQQNGSNPIVFAAREGKLTGDTDQKAIADSVKAMTKVPHVYSASDPTANPQAGLISKDGTTAFSSVLLDIGSGQLTTEESQAVLDAAKPARDAGLAVSAGGSIGSSLSTSHSESSEAVGILAAILILTLTFGSLVAMGMPILMALIGLATALGIVGMLGHVINIASTGPTLATMIGLGVGIDYALFLVTRHRDNLRNGMGIRDSIATAVATSGGAVVFAGGTVVIALLALAVAGIPLVTSLGYATAIAVFTAVMAAITLLPALLGVVGAKINSVRLPRWLHPEPKPEGVGLWAGWARFVTQHRFVSVLLALAILVPLAIPLLSLRLGQEDIGVTPTDTTERQAFDDLSAAFGPGYNGPLVVAVSLTPAAKADPDYTDQYDQATEMKSDLDSKQTILQQRADTLQTEQTQLEQQQSDLEKQGDELSSQQADLQKQANELQSQQTALEQQQKSLEAQGAQLQQQEASLQRQADQLTAQQASLERQAASLKAQEAALRNQAQGLQAQREQTKSQRAALIASTRQLAARLAGLERQRAQLRVDIAVLDRRIRTARGPYLKARLIKIRAAKAAQLRQVDLEVRQTEARLRAVPAQVRALAARARAELAEAQRLLRRAAALGRQAAGLLRQAAQLAAQAASLQKQADSLKAQASSLTSQAASLQQQANALKAQGDQLQQEGDALQKQADQLQQQGDDLQAQGNALSAQGDALKQEQTDAGVEQAQATLLQGQITDSLTSAGGDDRGTDPRLIQLQNALQEPKDVQLVAPPDISTSGTAATFGVIPKSRPAAPETADLVVQLRDQVIPPATTQGVTAYVGGNTAGNVDLAAKIAKQLPLVIGTIIALSFLLLMVAFRSLLIPLQAAIMNLLSAAAAFGVLTACFQWGWGLGLVGPDSPYGTVPIASFVPLMMFAALFGLSMDYEVFFVSQVQHHHAEGDDVRTAVRRGLASSARVIVAAAIIMISVFGSFIFTADPIIKQFGVGLATAVALAGLMVILLAPALLVIFGNGTFWVPRWLGRILPHLDIEGPPPSADPAPPPPPTQGRQPVLRP